MSLFKNNKMMLLLIVVVAIGGAWWYYSGDTEADPTVTSEADQAVASQELLLTLASLNTLTLDPSIFTDPHFAALSDFGVVIPAQPVGRRNPFAPYSGAQ